MVSVSQVYKDPRDKKKRWAFTAKIGDRTYVYHYANRSQARAVRKDVKAELKAKEARSRR